MEFMRLFHFFPLKDQKYLENSHHLAQRMVVEGGRGGYIREKNKCLKMLKMAFCAFKIFRDNIWKMTPC